TNESIMDIVGQLKGVKSFIKAPTCVIDNHVFRLHYRVTALILFTFSLLVTARQYFGDPIDCISKDDIPPNLLDTFCWIHTTFSLEHAWNKTVGIEVPYPGVDKYTPGEKRIYHAYYQWVCFLLFFQAIMFLIPRHIWKTIEDERIKTIRLDLGNPLLKTGEKNEQLGILIRYLEQYRSSHNSVSLISNFATFKLNFHFNIKTLTIFLLILTLMKAFCVYVACELFNFANVVTQMIAMDRFLGGQFTTYGWQVLQFTEWDFGLRFDPMIKVFPRLTKCTFHRYGSSGDVQKHDAMCILPINIINEKIYIFLWFWFYFLAVISLLTLIYRLATIVSARVRENQIRRDCPKGLKIEEGAIRALVKRVDVGDW
ncbi:Innexin inx2, partial [Fragariocoptes setiger]